MSSSVLLITPPFTQLNTPYPATAYLKGFLKTRQINADQVDLGIEVILKLFCRAGLTKIFDYLNKKSSIVDANSLRIIALKEHYLNIIDDIISFLQGERPTLAHRICQSNFLPRAGRFSQLKNLDIAFGQMGIQDKAKHLSTLFIEDISDLIKEHVDEHFGFSRYAERLGRAAHSFDELYESMQQPLTFIDEITLQLLAEKMRSSSYNLIAFSVPFPGNLYSAFRCAQFIKATYPSCKTAMGGGFPNTELRSLSDIRVMNFFDFITLDDGESPIEHLIECVEGKRDITMLKRCFTLIEDALVYVDNSLQRDYKQSEVGTPDYSDLLLDKYLSVIEIANPMHRLWSDGRWNKLTMAHGCYWGKCTFCDISLVYIKNYEPLTATLLCDQMEELIAQTGEHGFHFVDEAAPPKLMRALAIEIIKRKLVVSWWTNIRFEKSFTRDLCHLLKASGCIGVSGGLEVASDRLLLLIDKGVTVSQVAKVTRNLTESGIMVHAYLMYGFPTQTAQETIDSLEMVRQFFEAGILKSAFWHQFAMTAHSPIGIDPAKFRVKIQDETIGSFANNDIFHSDPTGTNHELFSFGLKKSLFNYMNGLCIDQPLTSWFEHKVPRPSIDKNTIQKYLDEDRILNYPPSAKVIWLGAQTSIQYYTKSKKGNQWPMSTISIFHKDETIELNLSQAHGDWLIGILNQLSIHNDRILSFQDIIHDYAENGLEEFDLFWYNKPMNTIYKAGLIII